MKKITKKELEVFLRKHKLWLCDEEGGERANLSGADLSRANLSGANLSGAFPSGSCGGVGERTGMLCKRIYGG